MADTAYSARNIDACEAQGIDPFICGEAGQSIIWAGETLPKPWQRCQPDTAPPSHDTGLKTKLEAGALRPRKANRRTRVRHHQVCAGPWFMA